MNWNTEEIRKAVKIIEKLSFDRRMSTDDAMEAIILGDIEYHAQEILKLLDELAEVWE